MTMLATRLNELAAAYEKGLLGDDEYRILRQDVFERYAELGGEEWSSGGVTDVGLPKANASEPTSYLTPNLVPQARPRKITRRPSEVTMNTIVSTSSEKDKKSSNNVLSSFIRRATSPLRSSASSPGPSNISSFPSRKSSHEPTILRPSSRKNSNAGYSNSYLDSIPDPHLLSPPTSPTRPIHNHKRTKGSSSPIKSSSSLSKSSSKTIALSTMSNQDIFNDGGHFTSTDIRRAIADLDEGAQSLMRAFDELEDSAVKRAKAKAGGRLVATPSSSSSNLNLLSPPTNQRRLRSDSAATETGSGTRFPTSDCNFNSSKSLHIRVRSRSTASIQPVATISAPYRSQPDLTPHTTSTQTPTLHRKGSVSSLASSFLSLKSKASMPSLPFLPPIPSISTMPSITRSRSGSNASSTPSSHNPSNTVFSSVSDFFMSSSGKSIERRPSMSTASSSGHGRSSTSTGASSIHTTTSTSSTGRTSISSGNGQGHTSATPTSSAIVHPHSLSHAASRNSITRSSSKFTPSTSVHFRGDSTDSRSLDPPGRRKHHIEDRVGDREKKYDSAGELDGLAELDKQDEVFHIQQRKRDMIRRYDARREYLQARLRGAELHERVVKGK